MLLDQVRDVVAFIGAVAVDDAARRQLVEQMLCRYAAGRLSWRQQKESDLLALRGSPRAPFPLLLWGSGYLTLHRSREKPYIVANELLFYT